MGPLVAHHAGCKKLAPLVPAREYSRAWRYFPERGAQQNGEAKE